MCLEHRRLIEAQSVTSCSFTLTDFTVALTGSVLLLTPGMFVPRYRVSPLGKRLVTHSFQSCFLRTHSVPGPHLGSFLAQQSNRPIP